MLLIQMTGLSGAGKSTIAEATQKKLTEFKPLADQFNFIGNLSKDIKVLGEKWMDNDLA